MNRLTKLALAGAFLALPTTTFAATFDGGDGAFFENKAPTYQNRADFVSGAARFKHSGDEGAFYEQRSSKAGRNSVRIVAGSFAEKASASVRGDGRLFNRADLNNDGVLNGAEQRRYRRLKLEQTISD